MRRRESKLIMASLRSTYLRLGRRNVNCLGRAFSASVNSSDTFIATHTGQCWDKDDIRMARFKNAPQQTNKKWAVNLINDVPPKPVKGHIAVCEGGPSEALGHPKIFINLDKPGPHSCIYCGIRFYIED